MRYRACNKRINGVHAKSTKVIMKPKPSVAMCRVVKIATPLTGCEILYSVGRCDEDDVLTDIEIYRTLRTEDRLE